MPCFTVSVDTEIDTDLIVGESQQAGGICQGREGGGGAGDGEPVKHRGVMGKYIHGAAGTAHTNNCWSHYTPTLQ